MTAILIDKTAGTPIGGMTGAGGLASAFDGVTSQTQAASASCGMIASGYVAANSIGKDWGIPRTITGLTAYAPSNMSFISTGSGCGWRLVGSNTNDIIGAALLASGTSGAGNGTVLNVQSGIDVSAAYQYHWLVLDGDGSHTIAVAEIQFYEDDGAGTATGGTTGGPVPAGSKPYAIFIGAGQSLMEGSPPNPDQSAYPNRARVKMFALDGTIKAAADPIMSHAGNLWPAINGTNEGCGPMMGFGDQIVPNLKNFDVLICATAVGGTAIATWAKGTPHYAALIDRARAALSAAYDGSFIAGLVWQQGESDCATDAAALAWPPAFTQMVADIRADLGLPELPVVMVRLGPAAPQQPAWAELRGIQQFMALPANCVTVRTDDLPQTYANSDWPSTDSIIAVGRRAADAMIPLLPVCV